MIFVLFNILYTANLSLNIFHIEWFAKYISVTKNVKISKSYIPQNVIMMSIQYLNSFHLW